MSSILDALKKLEADRTQPQAEAEAEAALPESFDVADAEAALFGKKKSAALPKPILLAAGAIGGVGAIIALSVWLSMYMVGRGPQTNT
ncbi:MAG: hypothetical protein IT368_14735, partial [Candidatus Hydrogenedentes bacterium]|nr:hypothetical protein [Candidatus Hydrogenedentota bacterium]